MKVCHRVVRDDMRGPIDIDNKKAAQLLGWINARGARTGLVPSDDTHLLVFATQEEIVGDQKVARICGFGPHAHTDVFKAAVADRQRYRTHYFLLAGEHSDFGVAKVSPSKM